MEQDLKRNQGMAEAWRECLSPEGYLVAVKLLKSLQGFEDIKRPEKHVTLCQLIAQTRYFGRTRIAKEEDLNTCYAAPPILGFRELVKEAWKRYVGYQMPTEEVARAAVEAIPHFPAGEYNAVLLSPLEKCPVAPDVVIFIGNASQMLVVTAAYIYNKGGTLTFTSSGLAACANIIVLPMKDKRPQIAIPGNGWKLLATPSNTDLLCGIPGELLEEMAEGMRFMRRYGGSQYPVAWQHIQWEPQPPISDLLPDDGYPSWIRKRT